MAVNIHAALLVVTDVLSVPSTPVHCLYAVVGMASGVLMGSHVAVSAEAIRAGQQTVNRYILCYQLNSNGVTGVQFNLTSC